MRNPISTALSFNSQGPELKDEDSIVQRSYSALRIRAEKATFQELQKSVQNWEALSNAQIFCINEFCNKAIDVLKTSLSAENEYYSCEILHPCGPLDFLRAVIWIIEQAYNPLGTLDGIFHMEPEEQELLTIALEIISKTMNLTRKESFTSPDPESK